MKWCDCHLFDKLDNALQDSHFNFLKIMFLSFQFSTKLNDMKWTDVGRFLIIDKEWHFVEIHNRKRRYRCHNQMQITVTEWCPIYISKQRVTWTYTLGHTCTLLAKCNLEHNCWYSWDPEAEIFRFTQIKPLHDNFHNFWNVILSLFIDCCTSASAQVSDWTCDQSGPKLASAGVLSIHNFLHTICLLLSIHTSKHVH